jgi:hypothetical protein
VVTEGDGGRGRGVPWVMQVRGENRHCAPKLHRLKDFFPAWREGECHMVCLGASGAKARRMLRVLAV